MSRSSLDNLSSGDDPSLLRAAIENDQIGQIKLVDHTISESDVDDLTEQPANDQGDLGRQPTDNPVTRSNTHKSFREQIAQRKFRRYREERTLGKTRSRDIVSSPTNQAISPPDNKDGSHDDSRWGQSRLDRGKRKARELARGKHHGIQTHTHSEAVVDILYENQRGAFFFGVPRFASASLLQFDPAPWVDSHFGPSAVDIRDAQVPDPSWQWDWKTWYVDMDRDVDEEGWEYSFWFFKGCSWHGTHPWFHSFVRRRRWIRRRVRKEEKRKTEVEGHALNPDYFTIHSTRRIQDAEARTKSLHRSTASWGAKSWKEQEDEVEILDVPSLIRALKNATIDRERIKLVQAFLENGGEELYYLADEIPHIMSMLVFQESRRQLVSLIAKKYDQVLADEMGETNVGRPDDGDTDKGTRDVRAKNLHSALSAADDEVKKLEFWSDVRDAVQEGDTAHGADPTKGWTENWSGIDRSGPQPSSVEHSPIDGSRGKGKAV